VINQLLLTCLIKLVKIYLELTAPIRNSNLSLSTPSTILKGVVTTLVVVVASRILPFLYDDDEYLRGVPSRYIEVSLPELSECAPTEKLVRSVESAMTYSPPSPARPRHQRHFRHEWRRFLFPRREAKQKDLVPTFPTWTCLPHLPLSR
jgi:hypothetical protein